MLSRKNEEKISLETTILIYLMVAEFKVTHTKLLLVFRRKKNANKTRKSVYTLKINFNKQNTTAWQQLFEYEK